MLYVFEENEALIKNDKQRTKPHDETRIPNPQSCDRLVFFIRSILTQQFKSNLSIPQKTTRLQFDEGSFIRDEWNYVRCLFYHYLQLFSDKLTTLKPCRRGKCRKEHKEEKTSAWLHYRDLREISSSSSHSLDDLRANSTSDSLISVNLLRWVRVRIAHQVLKCGAKILSRTHARRHFVARST